MVTQMKRYALNEQYLTLYEKVVPPVQMMETQTQQNTEEVKKLVKIIARYDENLCIKANKQEVMACDDKFRKYLRKDRYEDFKSITSIELESMKKEVKNVVTMMAKVAKNLENDISK